MTSIGTHATATRGPDGKQANPKRHDGSAGEAAGEARENIPHRLGDVSHLSVDPDRRIHRATKAIMVTMAANQRRPPWIAAAPPDQDEHEDSERNRHQRNPEITGRAGDLVDQIWQQRRQDTCQDAAGRDRGQAVAHGDAKSDCLRQ